MKVQCKAGLGNVSGPLEWHPVARAGPSFLTGHFLRGCQFDTETVAVMWAVLGVSGHAVFRVFLNTGSRTTGESPQACAVTQRLVYLGRDSAGSRPVPSSGDTARLLPAPCEVMETSSATIPSPGSCPPGSPILLSWSGHWGCPAEPVGPVAYPAAGRALFLPPQALSLRVSGACFLISLGLQMP